MAKVNVYLPDALYERVKAADINLSACIQDYLSVFLADRKPDEYAAHGRTGIARRMTSGVSECNANVYTTQRRWHWNCPCGASGGPYKRRMDADDAAYDHDFAARFNVSASFGAGGTE